MGFRDDLTKILKQDTYFVKLPSDETRKKWAEDYIAKGMKTQTEIETAELQGNVSDTKQT